MSILDALHNINPGIQIALKYLVWKREFDAQQKAQEIRNRYLEAMINNMSELSKRRYFENQIPGKDYMPELPPIDPQLRDFNRWSQPASSIPQGLFDALNRFHGSKPFSSI